MICPARLSIKCVRLFQRQYFRFIDKESNEYGRNDAKGSPDENTLTPRSAFPGPGSAMYGVTNARIKLKRWSLRRTAGSSQNRKVPNEGALRLDKAAPPKARARWSSTQLFSNMGTLFASRILHSPGTRHGIYVCVYLVVAVAAAAAELANLTYNIAVRGGRE